MGHGIFWSTLQMLTHWAETQLHNTEENTELLAYKTTLKGLNRRKRRENQTHIRVVP
jgi:hypothetical protein